MEWFRLYSEARNDAKLRSLNDGQFRVWFNLLCLAADQPDRGVIAGRKLSLVAVECAGGDVDLLVQTLDLLFDLDILHCEGLEAGATSRPRLTFLHFKKRQYTKPSDRPERVAERVKRQKTLNRAESRRIALDTETDTETESESEQKQNRTERTPPLPPQAGDLGSGQRSVVSSQFTAPQAGSLPTNGLGGRVETGTKAPTDLCESLFVPFGKEYSACQSKGPPWDEYRGGLSARPP